MRPLFSDIAQELAMFWLDCCLPFKRVSLSLVVLEVGDGHLSISRGEGLEEESPEELLLTERCSLERLINWSRNGGLLDKQLADEVECDGDENDLALCTPDSDWDFDVTLRGATSSDLLNLLPSFSSEERLPGVKSITGADCGSLVAVGVTSELPAAELDPLAGVEVILRNSLDFS